MIGAWASFRRPRLSATDDLWSAEVVAPVINNSAGAAFLGDPSASYAVPEHCSHFSPEHCSHARVIDELLRKFRDYFYDCRGFIKYKDTFDNIIS